jgi:signal transduction histidine kinase
MDARRESAAIGIAEIDPTGSVATFDEEFARLFGLRAAQPRPRRLDRLPPALLDCCREIIRPGDDGAVLRRWTLTIETPAERRPVEVVVWATGDDDGRVVRVLAFEAAAAAAAAGRPASSPSGAAERARLAREIHDGLAQELWLAKLTASNLARNPSLDAEGRALCVELLRSIDKGLAEARTAVLAMRADPEETITLSELVERQAEEFSDRFGVRVDCHVESTDPLPTRVSVEVLRVLQEALNNVRKHAEASRIVVRLRHRQRSITLSVQDDGAGFDPAAVAEGYGRQSMDERARSIGARLMVASAPGRGTTVTLRIPHGETER